MARPLIGLTTYMDLARFGTNEAHAAVLHMSYAQSVHRSGGRAVLITPDDPDVDVLDHLDGLILTGGSDVDPARYGEAPHPQTIVKPGRDDLEFLLLAGALERDLPVLAICRGFELLAVAYGGRLHQHLPDVLGHTDHRPVNGPSKYGEHPVRLEAGTRCHKILGDEVVVNSFHHQGIADWGRLTPAGWVSEATLPGGLLEAAEDPAHRFVLGVQWHPEELTDPRLFDALVDASGDACGAEPGKRPRRV
jgi:putative glutamine amidotransferase